MNIDIDAFWNAVLAQDADEMRKFFTADAYVNWHNTNEHLNVDEFIRANCEYPGAWRGEIEKKVMINDEIITVTHVYDAENELSFHAVSFIKLCKDKITAIDEYWGDDGDAPVWRREMGIGKKIK